MTAASPDETKNPNDSASPRLKKPGSEEPEMLLEPDFPSDGRDEVGDAMIRDLPVRPDLTDAPKRPA